YHPRYLPDSSNCRPDRDYGKRTQGYGCPTRRNERRSLGGNYPRWWPGSCERTKSRMKVTIRDAVRRHPEGITISLVILISLAFAVITRGGWISIGNLQSISQFTAVLAIIAFGEALVIATGEIDISVGSVSGIGALTFLGIAPTMGSGLALVASIICGILIGCLNGFFVAFLGLPSPAGNTGCALSL